MKNHRFKRALVLAAAGITLAACARTVPLQTGRPPVESHHFTLTPNVATRPLANVTLPSARLHLEALAGSSVEGRVLVISADGNEADLGAIKDTLQTMGTPYDVWNASAQPGGLTAAKLATGSHGNYQGVILTTGNLPVQVNGLWQSALTPDEWQALWSYEASFGVRQISWYTYPTADYGFGASQALDTTATPLQGSFTPAGTTAFPQLRTANGLKIENAYAYLAKPVDNTLTPWLTDTSGNVLVGLKTYPDGRQNVALTFDSNQYLPHARALAFGLVTWVTNGVFLGDRLTAMGEQVDDMFLDDGMWVPGGATGTDRVYVPGNATDPTPSFRINADDLKAFIAWQDAKRRDPQVPGLTTTLAFNGWGTTADFLNGRVDTLTPLARKRQDQFYWISHTWDHQNLDTTDRATTTSELVRNNDMAAQLGFHIYTARNLVQPDVSGLKNQAAMQAAYDTGVRFVISDTSYPDQVAPAANTGIVNALVPGIFEIPRHPVNLFYNVSTPAEWTSEYNSLYHTYWGRDLSYAEVLDKTSDQLVAYMLGGDLDPWMFHQPNMRAYDGTHSLLGDLTDLTLTKYERLFAAPVLFPTQDQLGTYFQQRMTFLGAGVKASVVPGSSITLSAAKACQVPVCGPYTPNAHWMGDHWVTYVTLAAGQSVTLPLTATQTPPSTVPAWPGAAPDQQAVMPPSPTPAPTASPSLAPSPAPTAAPTATPTVTPTATPRPTPTHRPKHTPKPDRD